ncbi:hypothetical protein ACTA71_005816 [Dictyostelium dimigraforme]
MKTKVKESIGIPDLVQDYQILNIYHANLCIVPPGDCFVQFCIDERYGCKSEGKYFFIYKINIKNLILIFNFNISYSMNRARCEIACSNKLQLRYALYNTIFLTLQIGYPSNAETDPII